MSKPSHIAYVVNKNRDDEKKDFWRPVGAVPITSRPAYLPASRTLSRLAKPRKGST